MSDKSLFISPEDVRAIRASQGITQETTGDTDVNVQATPPPPATPVTPKASVAMQQKETPVLEQMTDTPQTLIPVQRKKRPALEQTTEKLPAQVTLTQSVAETGLGPDLEDEEIGAPSRATSRQTKRKLTLCDSPNQE